METHVELPLIDLPVIEEDSAKRADAARNRARILCTAQRLFAERGAGCVSMDDIAEAAGVGKGTLFRRFGSRAALALAVLSEHESHFQEGFIRGEPPLGPGAPPTERLIAFGEGRMDLLAAHAEVLAAAEMGPARFSSPPYAVHRLHMTLLLREADPGCDAEYLAEALLACLGVDFYLYLCAGRAMPLERLKAGWGELVRRTVPAAAGAGESATRGSAS
jgi:AcrR family transcriptional regulator